AAHVDTAPIREAVQAMPAALAVVAPGVWTCAFCGEWQPSRPRGKKAKCPVCKTPLADPPTSAAVAKAVLIARPAIAQKNFSEHDDGKPYRVDVDDVLLCPGCQKQIGKGDVVCLQCGFDLRTGKKTGTVYQEMRRRWDAGLPIRQRWLIFAGLQCVAIPPMLWGMAQEGHAFYAILCWLWLSAMAAFIIGTFDRIDLVRNSRGKVKIDKTWHICFFPWTPVRLEPGEYEGMITGQVDDVDFSDYVMMAAGFGFFIVPGIMWYLFTMRRATFYIAFVRDHGHAELILYRGWSEPRMREMASTLRTAIVPEYSWY
ncbi:MAG: hypothetical protein ACRD36_10925, partial [Candidatus Acidiferrum sp.]